MTALHKLVSLFGISLLALSQGLAAEPCLHYEPQVVELLGTLRRHAFPGPPNYESVKKGDALEVYWLLHLPARICVVASAADDPLNELETGVVALQVLVRDYPGCRHLLGKPVKVTGTLFHALTGHHHPSVLIDPSKIEAAP